MRKDAFASPEWTELKTLSNCGFLITTGLPALTDRLPACKVSKVSKLQEHPDIDWKLSFFYRSDIPGPEKVTH
jgi:hypothetical protein